MHLMTGTVVNISTLMKLSSKYDIVATIEGSKPPQKIYTKKGKLLIENLDQYSNKKLESPYITNTWFTRKFKIVRGEYYGKRIKKA